MEKRFFTDKIDKGLKGETEMPGDLVLPGNKVIKIPLLCRGRDKDGKDVLKDPKEIVVCIYKSNDYSISTYVECSHRCCNSCGASNPDNANFPNWPDCPFQPTIPFVCDKLFELINKQDQENENFSRDCDAFFANL